MSGVLRKIRPAGKPIITRVYEMSIGNILHEASIVLNATERHASELSEVGVTNDDIHLMRVLITRIAVHSYTTLENNADVNSELRELQIVKEVIIRMAERRFGHTNKILGEFHYPYT